MRKILPDRIEFQEAKDPVSGKIVFVSKDMFPLPDALETGFGWPGIRAFSDETGERMQCHHCGKFMKSVTGRHTTAHGLRAAQYKELYGLRANVGAVSLVTKAKLVVAAKNRKLGSLGAAAFKDRGGKGRKKNWFRAEHRNMAHICDNQAAARYHSLADELGRVPMVKDLQSALLRGVLCNGNKDVYRRTRKEIAARLPAPTSINRYQPLTEEAMAGAFYLLSLSKGRNPSMPELARCLGRQPNSLAPTLFRRGWGHLFYKERPSPSCTNIAGAFFLLALSEGRSPTLTRLAKTLGMSLGGLQGRMKKLGWNHWLRNGRIDR